MTDRQSLLEQARALPRAPGVYIMKDPGGAEIYVGKAKDLRKRVTTYFQPRDRLPKEAALVETIAAFDYVETESELEAFLLENRLIKDLRPKYNFMLKNNEHYPLIEVTMGEDFPRVLVTRKQTHPGSRVFGPFVSAGDIKGGLHLLQKIFGFRTCSRDLSAGSRGSRAGRSCLNYQIGRCTGACRGRISKEDYRRRIVSLCRFLSGQKKDLLRDLRKEMAAEAAAYRFERAAELRDLVHALETVNEQSLPDESLAPVLPSFDPEKGLEALRSAADLPAPPRYIEGIDIANLQGGETVGSLVCFRNGLPYKDGYRRFRIRTVSGQDDYAAVAEVVRRRYGRLARDGAPLPDLVLIDGGKGQLRAAAEAMREAGASPGALMSLAKAEETPFLHGRDEPLPLSRRNAGLKLLSFVRDEAHRFAQHYHHILRRKSMFGEE
jgi:excinuclease ABC subunit C